MHTSSHNLCRSFAAGLALHLTGPLRIADVGSFDVNGTYRDLFQRDDWEYVGFDIRGGKNVDCVLEARDDWQAPEQHRGAFDVVISGQTLEHVGAIWKWIKSVASLCKPGGIIWLCAPNEEKYHEYPIDAWRAWPSGMRALLEEAGLERIYSFAEGPDTVGMGRKP